MVEGGGGYTDDSALEGYVRNSRVAARLAFDELNARARCADKEARKIAMRLDRGISRGVIRLYPDPPEASSSSFSRVLNSATIKV